MVEVAGRWMPFVSGSMYVGNFVGVMSLRFLVFYVSFIVHNSRSFELRPYFAIFSPLLARPWYTCLLCSTSFFFLDLLLVKL